MRPRPPEPGRPAGEEPILSNDRPTRDGVRASRLQLPPGPWPTLLDALCGHFPRIGRATWLDRFARGRVLDAAGRPLAVDAGFRAGAEVYYFREVPDEAPIPCVERIVYADAHLVVADKPHFLPVAPTGAYLRQTLLLRLQQRLGNPALVPLHRIDRDTAGLVMFSADPASRGAYQALFRERRIRKQYRATAPPLPALAFPHVHRSRIERGEPFFRMAEVEGPANSETRIEVAARHRHWWEYRLEPVTGRKHQLRVHMAALGAPIRNDPLYPQLQGQDGQAPAAALQLFAQALEFVDPLSGAPRRFSRPAADGSDAGTASGG